MPDPKYEPRDLLVTPRVFGDAIKPELRENVEMPNAKARGRATLLQHNWARATKDELKRRKVRGYSQKMFATDTGIAYQRLSRLLNGSVILRLEDIAACELVLGEGFYAGWMRG